MENASKALIIAGAILISILLISVGILIFNSSSGLFNSAKSKMSDQEKNMFNQEFTMFEGTKATASEVKDLIRKVNANNADDENPEITINGQGGTGETIGTKTIPGDADAIIKNAIQYQIDCTTGMVQGVVSEISIKEAE